LKEHNEGSNKWTRANRPFELVYQEQLSDKTDCLKREHVLKLGQGRKYLDSAISPK
jgi:predicted GIY-YIG superfamily endonuclease